MKAKLIKHKFGYNLVDTNGEFIATSKDEYSNGINLKYWLSKENCDEIFGVVDVEKLAFYEFPNGNINGETSIEQKIRQSAFKVGFKKAMELNKDKVFTNQDMIVFGLFCINNIDCFTSVADELFPNFQSLQPTEIEVAVEMERIPDGLDESCHIQYAKVPKLDSEGNLILKKL